LAEPRPLAPFHVPEGIEVAAPAFKHHVLPGPPVEQGPERGLTSEHPRLPAATAL